MTSLQLSLHTSGIMITGIINAEETNFWKGTYIVLFYVTNKPPHLALLVNGTVFSLGTNGQLKTLWEIHVKWIKLKKIKTLLVELSAPSVLYFDNMLYKEATESLLHFSRIEAGVSTCLSPVKDFCSKVFRIDCSDMNFIFDLLPVLFQNKHVAACYHYNLQEHLSENSFHLEKYTMQDIYESICRHV